MVPILRNHCLNCHNADKKKADLDASTYNGLLTGGGSGKVVLPQDTAGSLLWKLINHLEEPNMPPKAPKLPDAELEAIKRWIDGGLLENTGSKALAGKKPKVDLALKTTTVGKPDGPPPMPNGDLRLEPVVRAARPGAIPALAASPWAPLVAVAGQKQILLYHLDTLAVEGILPFPEGFPYVVKFSRSGQLLLAGGGVGAKLGKVVLFNVTTGQRVAEVGDEYDAVLAADVSPDQSRVALGGPSRLVRIYATATGELLHTIKKHTDWVTAIAYSPDGVLLATADRNGGIHLWEAETANAYSELKSNASQNITDLAWRDDANVIATTGDDGQIRLWEVENSTRVLNINAHPGGAQAVRFSHDGRLLSTGRDRTTKLWDANGTLQRAFDAFSDIALAAAISHDMTRVIAGDFTGEVRVWSAADGKRIGPLDANPPTLAERIETDGKQLAAAKAHHEKLAAAQASALAAHNQAAAALETARQNATNTAAASKTAEAQAKAAGESLAQAKSKWDGSAAQMAALEKNLARWKAGQFNIQVLAAVDDLAGKQAAAAAALAQADNLKAAADRVAADLAATQKALAAAAGLLSAKTEELNKAKATLDAAHAAMPNLKNNLAVQQAAAAVTAGPFQAAIVALAKAQGVLKALQKIVASADTSLKSAAETAAMAKAAADANAGVAPLAEAASKAQHAATESAAALEAARKAVTEIASQVKRATDTHAQAKAAADTAAQAVTTAQQALDKQPGVIQSAEAAHASANNALTQAKAMADELPKKHATLEKAATDSAAGAAAARDVATKAVAEVTRLKARHEQLLAEYQKLKPKA